MTRLEVRGLEKRFGNHPVLKAVSFSLDAGKTLAVLGPSGGGKTTLLRCLNFLETADRGQIWLDGQLLWDAAEMRILNEREKRKKRLHFGLVFQNFNLFPQYTALQNVALAGQLRAKREKDREKRNALRQGVQAQAHALLNEVGLAAWEDYYPWQLSGGQQQRVAIARALALQPDILCFDEPTSALDPELTGHVAQLLGQLRKEDMAMIVVTHTVEFARQTADQILFMDQGVVLEQGPVSQLLTAPQNIRTKQFLTGKVEAERGA